MPLSRGSASIARTCDLLFSRSLVLVVQLPAAPAEAIV
jgi:hypothetical protein